MLYHLAQALSAHVGGFNLFTYVTSRAVFAGLTALALGLALGPVFIRRMRRAGGIQPVRDDGPARHLRDKSGTPTMGGALILCAVFSSSLLWGDLRNEFLWLTLAVTGCFAAIGYADDRAKITRGNSRGLTARMKLLLQSVVALAAMFYLLREGMLAGKTDLIIPYMKDVAVPLGVFGFALFGWLVVVGASNAVNLTDGLDGLAIMPIILVSGGLAVYAYASGHAVFSEYLGLPHLPGAHELVVFCAALVGAGLAFLWFNAYPAEVFMGDVGSLAAGAGLATVAVCVRQELVFAVMGGVFAAEALSVMIQVAGYKSARRRFFLMAPLHHHFEKKGWEENRIVVRFWIVTMALVWVGLAALKIR